MHTWHEVLHVHGLLPLLVRPDAHRGQTEDKIVLISIFRLDKVIRVRLTEPIDDKRENEKERERE